MRIDNSTATDRPRKAAINISFSEAINLLATQEKLRKEIQVGVDQADRSELLDHDTVFGELKSIKYKHNGRQLKLTPRENGLLKQPS